ncbi:MAG: nuclear transport factor 2 family protein [Betaproteobacteria bacterium]|nr:MAG: nuclear transport factor 2 family protein [Betaproteobacteria bacterium]
MIESKELNMTEPTKEFHALIERTTQAICRGDGAAAAACFITDGVYHDGFYGEFRGHDAIRDMVENHFHANARDFSWTLSDALSDGSLAYARYRFSYISKIAGSEGVRVFFSGIAQVRLQDGLIARYGEVFDRGIALAQMQFAPERIAKSLARWAAEEKQAHK